MTLKTTYQEYLLEKIHKEYLYNGIIPTSDTLEEDLTTYQLTHLDLTQPAIKYFDVEVDHGSESSATLIQDIASVLSDDVAVATRELYRVAKESQKFYDRWVVEMKRLSNFARRLEDRVNSLLLLKQDTAGYFAHVSDVFADMEKIDTANTTARINLHESAIIMNPNPANSQPGVQIDLTNISSDDVTFSPLSQRPGTSYFTTGANNTLLNIFKYNNSTWVGKVVTASPGEMICELKAHVGIGQDLEVSRIKLLYTGPVTSDNSTITCQYSADGYNWYLVPTQTATKPLAPNLTWVFPLTTLRWIKFIFRKTTADAGTYEYVFAAQSLKLFGQVYDTTSGGTFITTALSTRDTTGELIDFSSVALQTCEEVPDNTSIKYSVAASKDNSIWTDWINIQPSTRNEILYPKVVNFGGVSWLNNTNAGGIDKFNNTGDLSSGSDAHLKLATSFNNSSLSSLLGYRLKTAHGVINSAVPVVTGANTDIIEKNIGVWRNLRNTTIYDYPDTYPDTSTVRSIPRGWGLDGNLYQCYFEVVNSSGLSIDFGSTTAIIDNQKVSGVVKIPQGIHKFNTTADNWFDIASNINELGITIATEETLSSIDPLYPYNHKLIIEGFPYSSAFIGSKVYKGTDTSAEFYMTKTSLFDLENNRDKDYRYFSVRNVGDSTTPLLAVITRYDTNNSDYLNELFKIRWRGGTDASVYNYIKLKAVLATEDSSLTPSLTSYRLKLGL